MKAPKLKAFVIGMALALGAGTATYTPPAQALTVFDPVNFTQNLQQALQAVAQVSNQVRDYAQQLQQVQNQYQQLANDARNLTGLPQSIFNEYTSIYREYQRTVSQLQGMMRDLSQARDNFQRMYPDMANGNYTFDQLSQFTRDWEQGGRQNIEDALVTGASVLDTLDATQNSFRQMGDASQSAQGALQAMQAGNQINMLVGQELMKLNTQTAVYQQAVLQDQARQQAIQSKAKANNERAYGDWGSVRGGNR